VLIDSGVAEMLEKALPTGGPRRQLGAHTVLVGILLSITTSKVAHLASAYRALCDLPISDQLRLGVARHAQNGLETASYRQLEHSFSQMMAPIDPSPVPSFRGVAPTGRAEHLAKRRKEVEPAVKEAMLVALTDALMEASVPEPERQRRCLAVDWTDHETWARPKDQHSGQISADPGAAWGHAKRNAPGAKDGLFFGYYAQVVVMAPEEGSKGDPEFIWRVVLKSASVEPAEEMARLLERIAGTGAGPSDVLADCGYSFKTGFAARLRRIGAEPVMDLHPFDRGPKGTFEGAVCANGSLYCPAVPDRLLSLGPLERGAATRVVLDHDRSCGELDRYRFAPLQGPDEDGYERVLCPAAAGKLRCLSSSHPSPCPLPARASPTHLRCHHDAVASAALPCRRTSTTRPAKSTPTRARGIAAPMPVGPQLSAPMPAWRIRLGKASAAAGAACSARRRTPSCTHWRLSPRTFASKSPANARRRRRPDGPHTGSPVNEGAGVGATSRARQANLS
jgi:hypothetical protein